MRRLCALLPFLGHYVLNWRVLENWTRHEADDTEPKKLAWFTGLLRAYWSNWLYSHLALLKINHFLVLTSMKWSMTQNTCHLQLVGKFKKLKKKWEIRFSLSLLFSCHFYVVASLCIQMETLISDACPGEFLSLAAQTKLPACFKNYVGSKLSRLGCYWKRKVNICLSIRKLIHGRFTGSYS